MKPSRILIVTSACAALTAAVWWFAGNRGTAPQSQAAVADSAKPGSAVRVASIDELRKWLHPQVRAATSPESVGYAARREAVRALPMNLCRADHQALMNFMNGDMPEEMTSQTWHALVDGIINVLRRQETAAEGLTAALISLYSHGSDNVLKDYAIQYLRHLYVDRDGFHKHETNPDARELILTTLIAAASQTEETYSGTALMGLDDITTSEALKKEPETQAQITEHIAELDAALVKAAASPETNKHCRISALQVCATRGLDGILPVARTLAADPGENTNIRISAIAAIGRLGNAAEDAQMLVYLRKQGSRLAYAAEPALEKLNQQKP